MSDSDERRIEQANESFLLKAINDPSPYALASVQALIKDVQGWQADVAATSVFSVVVTRSSKEMQKQPLVDIHEYVEIFKTLTTNSFKFTCASADNAEDFIHQINHHLRIAQMDAEAGEMSEVGRVAINKCVDFVNRNFNVEGITPLAELPKPPSVPGHSKKKLYGSGLGSDE